MKKVVKFGGSSLASAEQFMKVGNIIKSDPDRRFVIPSAPGKRFPKDTKVTDMLYACYNLAEEGKVPENLRFLCVDARKLGEIFTTDEIDKIYLNFSDPWPKDRHAKRRLPSKEFLSLYRTFLKKDGILEFKTDNVGLFDFSLEEINNSEIWHIDVHTYDLHEDPMLNFGNVMTEYEEKFSSKGNPICKLIASR